MIAKAAVCTPTEDHIAIEILPEIGEKTIQVANPDYIPATEGYYTTEANPDHVPGTDAYTTTEANPDYIPATPDTSTIVHHEAVTATQWKYVKNGGKGEIWLDYYQHGKVKIDGYWYQSTNKTREITVTEAWDETVVTPGTPAQGDEFITIEHPAVPAIGEETIQVWHEGTPAVGEEYITIDNPNYVPEQHIEIFVPGEDCPVQELPTPPFNGVDYFIPCQTTTDGTLTAWSGDCDLEVLPAVTQTVANAPVTGKDTLALTGGTDMLSAALLGSVIVLAGVGLAIKGLKRKTAR